MVKTKKKLFWIYDMDEAHPEYAYYEYMIWMKPHPLTALILNIWYGWSPPWRCLSSIYDMDEAPPPDYTYSEYLIWIKPLLNYAYYEYMIWMKPSPDYTYYEYMIWMKLPPWLRLFWIYDIDESAPPDYPCYVYMIWMKPSPDYTYYDYMIWMKPPPDYAYYEYMVWMKPLPPPLTTPKYMI